MAKLKGTSYYIIVTLWLTIQRHRNYSTRNLKKSPDLKYKDTFPAGFFGDEMAEERWFSQVKNTNTGVFQLENLKAFGIVPADFRDGEKPKNYPTKEVDTYRSE
jgi:hypothetical protein